MLKIKPLIAIATILAGGAAITALPGTSEAGRRRKYYRITREGRTRLAAQRQRWKVVDETLHAIWMKTSPA